MKKIKKIKIKSIRAATFRVSAWNSVLPYVTHSIWYSVENSVRNPISDSVNYSVWISMRLGFLCARLNEINKIKKMKKNKENK